MHLVLIFYGFIAGFLTFTTLNANPTRATTTMATATISSNPATLTPQTGTPFEVPETVLYTFYWFHTNALDPNLPIPTLRGRVHSVDELGFTKYRVTCKPRDSPAGCTYKDLTVTASGTSQMYYETGRPIKSVGCSVDGTTSAACSSRNHGEDMTMAVTKTWNKGDFPGYYPVLITAEPTANADWNWDLINNQGKLEYATTTPAHSLGSVGKLARGVMVGCASVSVLLSLTIFV
ncbi:hypothetical protein DRE_03809 [Drechslerella stenobrocha 248]|uniref:AA1-like domain-containing protein n=1 Tax=Drechslerella stenobrocha 248 TaxID=1043628 RepID=W7I3S6_9PEZI|nr:hypothetical protein DRE_03809 [Drechslerella stenobrocha 248]